MCYSFGSVAHANRLRVLLSSVASDAHSWNLVVLELALREMGSDVINLGPCTPEDLVVSEARKGPPDLIVISSVNGHGYQDGLRLIQLLRAQPGLSHTHVIIGGKLGITGEAHGERTQTLLFAGFDAVFPEAELSDLRAYVNALSLGGVIREAA
jgi:methylaspartate mutase sigma subunit